MDHGAISRAFRQELATDYNVKAPYRWGVVSAVHATTVDVKLDGSPNVTTGITYLASYCPAVGENVVVGRMPGMTAQSAHFVLGALASVAGGTRKLGVVILGAGTTTFSVPFASAWSSVRLIFKDARSSQAGADNVSLRFNGDTGANYQLNTLDVSNNATTASAFNTGAVGFMSWVCIASGTAMASPFNGSGEFTITGFNNSSVKQVMGLSRYGHATTNQMSTRMGFWNGAAVTSIGFLSNTGPGANTLSGTVDIYGSV